MCMWVCDFIAKLTITVIIYKFMDLHTLEGRVGGKQLNDDDGIAEYMRKDHAPGVNTTDSLKLHIGFKHCSTIGVFIFLCQQQFLIPF